MGLNKEDFRHFMLDSHKYVGKGLLPKRPPAKVHLYGCRKRSCYACLQHMAFISQIAPLMSRASAGATAAKRTSTKCTCASTRQHQQLLPAKEKAASEIPFVDKWPQGQSQPLSLWVPPAERECHAEPWFHPTPYPTASQVGTRHSVGREWVYPKRGGPGFYLV